MRVVLLAISLAPTFLAAPAASQAHDPSLIASLQECRNRLEDDKRLACFDRTLDQELGVSEELQKRRMAEVKDRFGRPDNAFEQITELRAVVVNVDADPRTSIGLITLKNGQVWETTSQGSMRISGLDGQTITIVPNALSGYKMTVQGRAGFRGVKRRR